MPRTAFRKIRTSILLATAVLACAVVLAPVAPATGDDRDGGRDGGRDRDRRNDDKIIYSSIPKRLPGNVASIGPEAYAYREVGDGLVFVPGAGGILDDVTVILSSWGCVTGNWFSNNCATPRGSKFSIPITLKVYSVIDVGGPPKPTPGTVLATLTKTFDIPFRPSADPVKCPDAPGKWYSERDKTCYNGIAVPIEFDLKSLRISVPPRIIVGVTFNSSHYGYTPIGESAPCYASSGGCPYDSLNVSSDGGPRIGSVVDPDGIFLNAFNFSPAVCPGYVDNGQMQLTTPCWTGFHPQIEVTATERRKPRSHRREDPRD
jgi:hypothetical protein